MEKLWSPWRSNYIDSFKTQTGDEKCVFCEQETKSISDENSIVVYKGDKCFVTLNLYPYHSGHLMIIPFRHLSDFNDLSTEEMAEVMNLVQLSMKALDKVMSPHGFNFGANIGRAAGAGIDQHLHFHIVPRWSGDSNFMPVLGDVKVISQDLLVTKNNLIKAFAEIIETNKS